MKKIKQPKMEVEKIRGRMLAITEEVEEYANHLEREHYKQIIHPVLMAGVQALGRLYEIWSRDNRDKRDEDMSLPEPFESMFWILDELDTAATKILNKEFGTCGDDEVPYSVDEGALLFRDIEAVEALPAALKKHLSQRTKRVKK